MDHLNFEGGGGGRIGLRKFFLTGQCFSFTVKALQGIFFSNRPYTPLPPGPSSKVKWSAPYHKQRKANNIFCNETDPPTSQRCQLKLGLAVLPKTSPQS